MRPQPLPVLRVRGPTPTLAQPDPTGARLAVLRPALEQLRYIEGFFFESGGAAIERTA